LPETISLRNFEIPPKFDIFWYFPKNKNPMCRRGTTWIFKIRFSHLPFLYCIKTVFVCGFHHTPLCKMMFSQGSICLVGMNMYLTQLGTRI
jgi:hypothetical protein